jgi:16S rRNA processing protein RimM
MKKNQKICIGMITGPHGVRGLVRLRSFTEVPESILDYGILTDESGKREFVVELKSTANDFFIAAIDGVNSREDAEAIGGTRLYIDRAKLPKTKKREYYNADLVGLAAEDAAGKSYGTVMGVHDYGAGSFLEIGHSRKDSFMLPFTDVFVPEVDVDGGGVVISVPEGWLSKEDSETPKVDL